jgi:hypothetical protein
MKRSLLRFCLWVELLGCIRAAAGVLPFGRPETPHWRTPIFLNLSNVEGSPPPPDSRDPDCSGTPEWPFSHLFALFCNLVNPSARTHSFSVPKTHFPQPTQNQRAVRMRFHSMAPAAIRFEDGRHRLAKLRTVSLTGGLLRLPQPPVPGTLIEVIFISNEGPVQGLAELLTPALDTLKCLQPFKFIMIDDDDYRRLGNLIRSSVSRTPEFAQCPRLSM